MSGARLSNSDAAVRSRARSGPGWPNVLVIGYILAGWPLALWALTRDAVFWNLLGVLLAAHTLVWAAYLLHDCTHNAVFVSARGNDRLGALLAWITGACIADYAGLKKMHLRHHSDRLDVVTFDYRATLLRAPAWLRRGVLALEWAYVPAVELVMRGLIIALPFQERDAPGMRRMVWILSLRLLLWGALALVSVKAVVLYAVGYLSFLTVLRYMDAFQHTYEVFPTRSLQAAPADPRRDLRYEYENTFSNLLAVRWRWFNLLVLNFPYHNAHHTRPGAPWYRLPELHRTLYGPGDPQILPLAQLLASFHRHRVTRVLAEDYGDVGAHGDRAGNFVGAVGVSFLTAV